WPARSGPTRRTLPRTIPLSRSTIEDPSQAFLKTVPDLVAPLLEALLDFFLDLLLDSLPHYGTEVRPHRGLAQRAAHLQRQLSTGQARHQRIPLQTRAFHETGHEVEVDRIGEQIHGARALQRHELQGRAEIAVRQYRVLDDPGSGDLGEGGATRAFGPRRHFGTVEHRLRAAQLVPHVEALPGAVRQGEAHAAIETATHDPEVRSGRSEVELCAARAGHRLHLQQIATERLQRD